MTEETSVVVAHPAELRIALVCYGGVSLAIYMHGVTKELHKLVQASRRYDRASVDAEGPKVNPFSDESETEWAYFEALRDLEKKRGAAVSVTIDVIAGTSAGGINGICLAKVLATGGNQDNLRTLWLEVADLEKLLVADKPGKRGDLPATLLAIAAHWDECWAPLKGDLLSRELRGAITQMEGPGPLLPEGGTLDLYVTTTDLHGFPVVVSTGAGGASQLELNHHQVVQFCLDAERNDFLPEATDALAFAGRATSCFPGAFKPVSIESFREELEGVATGYPIQDHFQHRYRSLGVSSDDAWFVDGGVLDNAPFGLAVQAIAEKSATSEVLRRLVYIQPDPGTTLGGRPQPPAQIEPPYLMGGVKSVFSVRGSHSILPDLRRLRDLNLRIAAVADLAHLQEEQVATAIGLLWTAVGGAGSPWDISDRADVDRLASNFYTEAKTFVGHGFPGYCQLKVETVTKTVAAQIAAHLRLPANSNAAAFIRASLGAWARRKSLNAEDGFDTTHLVARLGQIDMPYRERRLMFILAKINEMYADLRDESPDRPTRGQLDALKSVAWHLLKDTRRGVRAAVTCLGSTLDFLAEVDAYADPEDFATSADQEFLALFDAYAAALGAEVKDSTEEMWSAFGTHAGSWHEDHRKALLTRYVAFPLWDALLFPTLALSDLPQYTPVEVSQFSPLAATALQRDDKLKGVGFAHFAAFFDIAYRENDYLWGRLDGAELILRTLRGTADQKAARISPLGIAAPTDEDESEKTRATALLQAALLAVLASEKPALTHLPDGFLDGLKLDVESIS